MPQEDTVGLTPEDLLPEEDPTNPQYRVKKTKPPEMPQGAQSPTLPEPPAGSTAAQLNSQLANNPDYTYVPGQGYVYKGYSQTTGNVSGRGNVSVSPTGAVTGPNGAHGSGDTGYDWLGFAQGFTGGQNVSRGGSNGGFITGGAAHRGNLQPVVDAYNAKYNAHAKVAGEDKIDFGDGRGPQDILTAGGDFWYGGPPGSMQGAGGGVGTAASGPAGGGATTSGSSGVGGQYDSAVHDAIMKLLGRGFSASDENDPTIKAQFDPMKRQLEQGAKDTRAAAAQRLAYGSGGNSGGQGGELDATTNAIMENLGQQKSAAMGEVVAKDLQGKRQDVVNALNFAQGEERLALQLQLTQIDAELRRQGLSQQNSQFYDTMGYNIGRDNAMYDYLYSQMR